jgi:nicotinate-nucleotide adenylyltransferase
LALVNIAVRKLSKIKKLLDIEFHLSQPNYTINTLAHLEEKFPTNQFCLIMGEDS